MIISRVTKVKEYCLKTQKFSVIINQTQAYTHSQNCNADDIVKTEFSPKIVPIL